MDKEDRTKDTVLERGEIVLNGYKFTVKPIYFMEEAQYLEDVPIPLYPNQKEVETLTEKDKSRFAITVFMRDSLTQDNKTQNVFKRIVQKIRKFLFKDYRYYSENKSVLGIVKWIERKVYYKGRQVRFYDLERKFKLNKSEIVDLFGFFQDLSGF